MFNLSTKQTVVITVFFSLVLWITRGQHVASLFSLPDATWAISFMAGFLFGPLFFLAILAQAILIDYFAMGNDLINAAYFALIPAYLALYLTGKWFRSQYDEHGLTLGNFALSFIGGVAICEFVSSSSFYLQKSTASLGGFVELFGHYFFNNLFFSFCYVLVSSLAFYLLVGTTNKKLA
jgi:hypothetical protein